MKADESSQSLFGTCDAASTHDFKSSRLEIRCPEIPAGVSRDRRNFHKQEREEKGNSQVMSDHSRASYSMYGKLAIYNNPSYMTHASGPREQ